MSFASHRGVVYVATGERYVSEASSSREQLRRTNPTLPAALVTDAPNPPGDWQHVIPLPDATHTLRDKIAMRLAPWPEVLFLDSDTHVAASLDPVFALLSQFDIAAHQLFEGHDYLLADVPDSFPEFNTGVIAFRNSAAVHRCFDTWAAHYDRLMPTVRCDQRSFRIALYHSGLRHTVLTPEYNFRPLATNFAITDLRIIHGRPLTQLAGLKSRIDVNLVHRAYVPRLGCVVSDHMTLRQSCQLWRATSVELLKSLSRPIRRLFGQGS